MLLLLLLLLLLLTDDEFVDGGAKVARKRTVASEELGMVAVGTAAHVCTSNVATWCYLIEIMRSFAFRLEKIEIVSQVLARTDVEPSGNRREQSRVLFPAFVWDGQYNQSRKGSSTVIRYDFTTRKTALLPHH